MRYRLKEYFKSGVYMHRCEWSYENFGTVEKAEEIALEIISVNKLIYHYKYCLRIDIVEDIMNGKTIKTLYA